MCITLQCFLRLALSFCCYLTSWRACVYRHLLLRAASQKSCACVESFAHATLHVATHGPFCRDTLDTTSDSSAARESGRTFLPFLLCCAQCKTTLMSRQTATCIAHVARMSGTSTVAHGQRCSLDDSGRPPVPPDGASTSQKEAKDNATLHSKA